MSRFLDRPLPFPLGWRIFPGAAVGRLLPVAFVAIAAFSKPSFSAPGIAEKPGFIEGRVFQEARLGPVLKTSSKQYRLTSSMNYLIRTLQDPRLAKSELRLEGTIEPDGEFAVDRILTVHHGKLYRVRYYCETCNIEALAPGRCVCCQHPTELQEVPLDPNDHEIIIDR